MKHEKTDNCPLCDMAVGALKELEQDRKTVKIPSVTQKKSKGFKIVGAAVLVIIVLLLVRRNTTVFNGINSGIKGETEQVSLKGDSTFEENYRFLQIDSFAPDFATEDIAGNKVTLSEFRNRKPVLLVFWATWCGYCAKELPNLEAFNREYQNEVQVFVIPSGEVRNTIEKYIKDEDVNLTVLLDETRDIWNAYLVRGTPSHFLIDGTGKIATLRPGLATLRDLEALLTMLPKP